jgi:Bacterial aa3 type cytochrome c oxidase subunit IV
MPVDLLPARRDSFAGRRRERPFENHPAWAIEGSILRPAHQGNSMQIDTSKAHPAMDYRAHFDTYRGFVNLAFWGSILVAIILVLMKVFLV